MGASNSSPNPGGVSAQTNPFSGPTMSAQAMGPGQGAGPTANSVNYSGDSSQGQAILQAQKALQQNPNDPAAQNTLRQYGLGSYMGANGQSVSLSQGKNAPPVDPTRAAQQQADQQKTLINQQTQANRPDINTQFGSQQWTQGPDGQWTMNAGLNGQLGGAANSLQGQIQAQAGQPIGNGDAARDQAINSAYGQATSRLDPQWQEQGEQLQTQLANQGLAPGSQAYNLAMQQFGQQKNDAYTSAMNSAVGQGTAAQQATFGENLQAANNPYSQIAALQGLTGTPGFNTAGAPQAPDLLGGANAYNSYNLGQQQVTNQLVTSGINGLTSAGAAAAGASDERVKTDVHRLPVQALPGVPFATFAYKQAPKQKYLGVIAQDLERVAPGHVGEDGQGVKHVSMPFRPFALK